MKRITFKSIMASGKPYQIMGTDEYLNFLAARKEYLHSGDIGVYISRQIEVDGQKLYFPFIDIDAARGLQGDEKINSAIFNAQLTLNSLKKLGVQKYFKIIATGGSGFRIFSNILLNKEAYRGFVEFIKSEMPHIIDMQPTEEMEMPHQLFVYKGHPAQNKKQVVDRHSVIVSWHDIESGIMTPDYYKEVSSGKLDPDSVIRFMADWFDSLITISDFSALGEFGNKIKLYRGLINEVTVRPFNYLKLRKDIKPIALDVMHEMLRKKGIVSRIKFQGKKQAISFNGLPCPSCGKTTANARAYPPHYQLRCFNVNCPASGKVGLPLHEWSGIKTGKSDHNIKSSNNHLNAPTFFEDKNQAREIIKAEIENDENVLLLITPGVGKTHVTLELLSGMAADKQILYSCFNKKLRDESFDKIKSFSADHSRFHKFESRDDICKKRKDLDVVISKGFSPSEMLCRNCEYRLDCQYFKQKENPGKGVYFVIHQMLQYLEKIFQNPDLIVLDENLVSGFLLEETCAPLHLRSLNAVLSGVNFNLITDLISLSEQIGNEIIKEKSHPMIINGRKLTGEDVQEDSIIGLLAKQKEKTEYAITHEIGNLISEINKHSRPALYKENVNLKAVKWLSGLISPYLNSYLQISEDGECFFNTKYITPLGYPETPIKILDATGDGKAVQVLTERKIKTVKVDVAWNSKKVHFQVNTGRGVLKYAKDSDLKKLLAEMLSKITADKVMVITYKFLTEKVLKLCREIYPAKAFENYHFQGERGINKFEEFNAVIVVGLPFSNLNSSAQDAYILFPHDMDKDIRDSWVDSCMMWELIQNIHRIRPVNKDSVEIVIASSYWPPVLPKADEIIDKSKTDNKDLIISRLDPFVKEFGFLNSDIGYIANVYQKSQSKSAKKFQRKLFDVLNANNLLNCFELEEQLKDSTLSVQERFKEWLNRLLKNKSERLGIDGIKSSTIVVLYTLYYYNFTRLLNPHLRTFTLNIQKFLGSDEQSFLNYYIKSSNTQQWAELKIHFKKKYSHFEEFEIKLPHATGKSVSGVGDKQKVLEFYQNLNQLEIFGNFKLETYTTKEICSCSITPIPDGFISVFIPPDHPQVSYAGIQDTIRPFVFGDNHDAFKGDLLELFSDLQGKQIITNNGKVLAKHFLQAGLGRCEIIDVLLNEKMISNGEVDFGAIDLEFIFKKYQLPEDTDINMNVSQLYQVWQHQEKLIQDMRLKNVLELEKRILWISEEIELAGMEVDAYGMLEYQEKVRSEIQKIESEIFRVIPEHVSLTNYEQLKTYINRTFRLELKEIKQGSVKYVTDPRLKELIQQILTWRQLTSTNQYIDRYIRLIDNQDRIHDSIDQLRTKNGRFYRSLHGVKKDGLLRTFFRARNGYKLVIADYSAQEMRIISGLAKDERAIGIFKNGKDIYLEVAKDINGKPEAESKDFRDVAKKIVLGLNNGQTEYSICEELQDMGFSFTQEEVRGLIDNYFQKFSGIKEFRSVSVAYAFRNKFISTRFGRRMAVLINTEKNTLYNYPITATGSDGFKLALIGIDQKLKGMDARIVHIVHDEIIVEVREDISEDVSDIVKKCMESALERLVPEVPFVVEPEIRETWSEIKRELD